MKQCPICGSKLAEFKTEETGHRFLCVGPAQHEFMAHELCEEVQAETAPMGIVDRLKTAFKTIFPTVER